MLQLFTWFRSRFVGGAGGMSPQTPSIADVLERAADIMNERGKADFAYIASERTARDTPGSCCTRGSIMLARAELEVCNQVPQGAALYFISKELDPQQAVTSEELEFGILRNDIDCWNMDHSKDDVVAMIRRAAALAREAKNAIIQEITL